MKTLFIVSALALVLAMSCRNNSERNQTVTTISPVMNMEAKAEAPTLILADASNDTIASSTGFSPGGEQQQPLPGSPQKQVQAAPLPPKIEWNKKIIKHASLELEVKDFKSFNNQVMGIAGKYGGYIAEEKLESSDYKVQTSVSIRVPVDMFDPAVTDLGSNAVKILTRNITSKDVTGEVVDTRSRLEAKRTARLRYLDLMKQAKNMEEVFQVQKEVDEIQEEIEAAAGRVSYLNHSAAYSTIELTYFQILNPDVLKDKERDPSFGDRILDALKVGFNWVGDLMVVLLTLWPLWLIVGLLFYLVKKRLAIHRMKAAAAAASEPPKV